MKTIYKALNFVMVLSLMFGMWPVMGVSAQGPVDELSTPEFVEETQPAEWDTGQGTDLTMEDNSTNPPPEAEYIADDAVESITESFPPVETFSSPDMGVMDADGETTFAIISDYGYANDTTVANVANMVNSWNPEFIVTAGDNSQGTTCDTTCYQGVVGAYYGPEAVSAGRTDFMTSGNFWPVPGNHDYMAGGTGTLGNYLAYFNYLPPTGTSTGATARYYDFVRGPVHFFMLDSGYGDNSAMPDQAAQQTFLQNGLAASTSPWNIVMFHRPAYTSSSLHPSDTNLQWPYEAWGADFVIAGHVHIYERIYKGEGDLRYLTTGPSGNDSRTGSATYDGLEAYYFNGNTGAMRVVATNDSINFEYITANGTTYTTRDTYFRGTSSTPTITTSTSSLSAFTTLAGQPSAAQTYSVSGTNLTENVLVYAPDGFEISSDGVDYYPNLTLYNVDGIVASTTISVRMTGADGSFSGDITHSSDGAITRLVSVSGTTGITTTASFQEGVGGYTGMLDTDIHQGDPTYNYGASSPLSIDSDDPYNSGDDISSLLYWDLASIPEGSMLESASITVYVEDVTESPGYEMFAMNQFWVEGSGQGSATGDGATWNTYDGSTAWPGGEGGAGDRGTQALAVFAPTQTGTLTVDLNTQAVSVLQGWINGPASNSGFMIHAGSTSNGLDFTSSEGSTAANRPKLTLVYSMPTDDPIIVTSASSLPAFKAVPGFASSVASYTVQALNLVQNLVITAPADFQVSTSSTSGFGQSVTLVPESGAISSTTIYVRFLRAALGTSSGEITHVSSPAATKTIAVSGTAAVTPPWTAYNDMSGTSSPAYTTEFTLDQVDGMLLDFDSGDEIGVTVTVTSEGGPYNYTDGGVMPDEGTDAYTVFNGKVDLQGVIMSATSDPVDYHVDLTFADLDPEKTYTFVATANRNGTDSADPEYTARFTRYTISGIDAAVNVSSAGVQVNNEYSITFCTGFNTTNGYVAHWENIQPGSDGIFTVRAQPEDSAIPRTYAFGAFMLLEEAGSSTDIQISSIVVDDITGPVALATPDTVASVVASPSDGVIDSTAPVTWQPADVPFAYSTIYTASVTLTAAPGYYFTNSTVATINGQLANVSLNGNGTLTVSYSFARTGTVTDEYTITVSNDGGGTVTLDPPGGTYEDGTVVTLTPVPGTGYVFDDWSGANAADIVDTAGVYTILMNGNKEVTANFKELLCTTVILQDGLEVGGSTYSGTRDTYIFNTSPTTVRGTEATFVQDYDSETVERRSLLSFDLSAIPAGTLIESAELNFYITNEGRGFNMYRMLVPWDEAMVTYSTIGNRHFQADGIDAESVVVAEWTEEHDGETGFFNLDIPTSTIQDWVDGTLANNGWLMISTDVPGGDGQQIASREATAQDRHPKLTVTYCTVPEESTILTSVSTLSPFQTQPGSPSTAQTYTVSGVNLENNIDISAPAGFEISTDGSTFSSSLALPHTGGMVGSTMIYVRLTGAAAGDFSGNIAHVSSPADLVNVAVSGNVASSPSSFSVRVNQGSDDAEEALDDGEVSLDSTDLEIINDSGTGGPGDQIVGIRFQNVMIPPGALIQSAYIEFEVDETGSDAASITISGEAIDNPVTFTEATENISDRSKTAATVTWVPDSWTTVSAKKQTSNLHEIVQEIVNRGGWSSGNAMAFLFEGSGTRIAEAYEGEPDNAPLLVIEYYESTLPAIYFSSSMTEFSAPLDVYSPEQSYNVTGANLTENITVTAPVHFEVSLTGGGSGFGSMVELPPSGATVYVRFKSATEGTTTADIIHSSSGVTENLAVTGTAYQVYTLSAGNDGNGSVTLDPAGGAYPGGTTVTLIPVPTQGYVFDAWTGTDAGDVVETGGVYTIVMDEDKSLTATFTEAPPWTAYNDVSGTSTPANTTEFTVSTTDGLLLDFTTGAETGATVTVTTSGTLTNNTTTGAATDMGTDAYETFNGKVNMVGVVQYNTSSAQDFWMDLTFEGLDPAKTYTFATTVNRNDSSYTDRISRFTISGIDAAANASTTGTSEYEGNPYAVYFCTGYNTVNGYVARWTNIDPGEDGTFTVRAQPNDPAAVKTYAFGMFMLQEEVVTVDDYTLTVNTVGDGSVVLDPTGGTYDAGTKVFLTPVPGTDYGFDSWSGADAPDVVNEGGGTWSIVMDEDKSITANFAAVSNHQPTDVSLANASIAENEPTGSVVGAFSTSDPDVGDTHTYALVSGDGGVDNASFTIDGNQLKIAAAFNFETKNSYAIRVRSTDQGGLFFEEAFTITVTDVNEAPVLGSIGGKSVAELVALTFTASATDVDVPAQTLSFSLDGSVPSEASITAGGVFSWTPGESDGGKSYTFDVCVSDGALEDCETITVSVTESNSAPVFAAIGNKEVLELSTLYFTASATDPDVPDNTLTYSLVGAPLGASFNATSGLFSWTPTEEQGPGSYDVTVKVCDNGSPVACDEVIFTITVGEVNLTPAIVEIGNKSVNELESLSFTANVLDLDLPANALSFSLIGAPTGATIGNTSGIFSWTPTEEQGPGLYTLTVKVCDSGLPSFCDEETIKVNVAETNSAPQLDPIGNRTTAEMIEFTFTATTTDTDVPVNTMTYSLVGAPSGAAIDSTSGVFTWTPTELEGPDSYPFDVCVSDGMVSDCETITLTVIEANIAPTLGVIGAKTVAEMATLSFTAIGSDVDLPANTLTYRLEGAPAGASIDSITGAFSWTPTEEQGPGSYEIGVCVDDGIGAYCETITVMVTEVNSAPVLAAIVGKTVDEMSLLSFSASATDDDMPTNTLVYSLAGTVPAGASITTGGAFSWTPAEAQGPGSYTFDVCVSDGTVSDCEKITVDVAEVNVAPVLGAIGAKTIQMYIELTFNVLATDADIPANSLIYSLQNGAAGLVPAGASISSEGVFSWTPLASQGPAIHVFDVCVSDGALTDCETISVEVIRNTNDPPVITETDPVTVTISEDGLPTPFALMLHATDPDVGATLTWSVITPAQHGSATASGTGLSRVIGYAPVANYNGNDSFVVQVSDGSLTDTITVNVVIEPVNDAPIADEQSVTIHEDEAIAIKLTGSDLEGSTLTFEIATAPLHGTLSGTAPNLLYTPASTYNGEDSFTFIVNDGDADSAPATISILVQDPTPWMYEKLTTSKVVFNWKDIEGATKYKIQLSTKANFSKLIFSAKTTQSKYPYATALKYSKTYYWRVSAKVNGFWQDWTYYTFYSMDPLEAPVLRSPSNKATVTTHTPEFAWEAVENGVTYKIRISNTSNFSTTIAQAKITSLDDTPTYLAKNLPNGKYYWKVRAIDASGGKGPWSSVWIVKVAVP